MSVDIQVLGVIVAIIAAVAGGYYTLAALIVRQFKTHLDERFAGQDKERVEGRRMSETRLGNLEVEHRALDRNFLKFLAELPEKYQRREDTIRFETVINAKLDALYSEMRLLAERQLVKV